MSARRAFLGELIDDAGLFPPAQLAPADALEAHERAGAGEEFWMQGRFVVPRTRLREIATHVDDSPDPLEVSVILEGDSPLEELHRLRDLVHAHARSVTVGSIEYRLPQHLTGRARHDLLEAMTARIASGADVPPASLYIEVSPADRELDETFALLARLRADGDVCAKLRCGGLVAEAVPSPHMVARFIVAARDAGIPFKATAGLHHPVRHENADAGFRMHGFLNVIGAAALAHAQPLDESAVESIVADEDPAHFQLDDERFVAGEYRLNAEALGAARASFVHSFGSCNFDECVDDLRGLGMLEPARA